jgi:hypothetical protein
VFASEVGDTEGKHYHDLIGLSPIKPAEFAEDVSASSFSPDIILREAICLAKTSSSYQKSIFVGR